MPSPFPGMDPYLESPAIWPDFHLTLIGTIRRELIRRLSRRYMTQAERYVWVEEPETEQRRLLGKPDVQLTGEPERSGSPAATVLAAPVEILLPSMTEKGNPYLKIIDSENRRLVTVIELLSPANKTPGKDREVFLLKRREYLATGVNLVEMDLLRKGPRLPWGTPPGPGTDYYIMVSRFADRPRAGVWPFSVREVFPEIPIPLDPEDPDVPLPLGVCMTAAYDDVQYDRELDYTKPPNPPLAEPDATWARELLSHRHVQPT